MYSLQTVRTIVVFLVVLLIVSACGGGKNNDDKNPNDKDTDPQSNNEATLTLRGRVIAGEGLPGVSVDANGVTVSSDDLGMFSIDKIPLPDTKQLVVSFTKAGYPVMQKIIPVERDGIYDIVATMADFEIKQNIDPKIDNVVKITDENRDKIIFELDANALADNVESAAVSIVAGDPTTEQGQAIFPGNYSGQDVGGETVALESIAFADITMTNSQGEKITDLNKSARVTLLLPEKLQSKYQAGDRIPWWSYDTSAATWVREDADPSTSSTDDAKVIHLDGRLYAQASITHLSWWNVDMPVTEHACFKVKVIDDQGDPLSGQRVTVLGQSYTGRSEPVLTDADGYAWIDVKRSQQSITETVKLFVEHSALKYRYDVTDGDEGDPVADLLYTPSPQGSAYVDRNQCFELQHPIAIRLDGTVTGTLIRQGSSEPVVGWSIFSSAGSFAQTDSQGRFTLKVPLNHSIQIYARQIAVETLVLTETSPSANLELLLRSQSPIITAIDRSIEGVVTAGETIELTVNATDPDGDEINYLWSASHGQFDVNDQSAVNWSAPQGNGFAEITVIVSDDKGGESRITERVFWQTNSSGDHLRLAFRNNPVDQRPMENVTVALYNEDRTDIIEIQISAGDGVVAFDTTGKTSVSFTAVYALVDAENNENFVIETFVDIPPLDTPYYIEKQVDISPFYYPWRTCNDSNKFFIDYNIVNLPTDYEYQGLITPIGAAFTNSDLGTLDNVSLCGSRLAESGGVSLLTYLTPNGQPKEFRQYGYLLDQSPQDGDTLTIDLDQYASPVVVTTSTDGTQTVAITGMRNAASFTLGESYLQADSTAIPTMTAFPANYYSVSAVKEIETGLTSDMATKITAKTMAFLPGEVAMTYSNHSITNVETTANTVQWQLGGDDALDQARVTINVEAENIYWHVLMPPNGGINNVTMPLPSPADGWILGKVDRSNVDIDVLDFAEFEGYIETINATLVNDGYKFESSFNGRSLNYHIEYEPILTLTTTLQR